MHAITADHVPGQGIDPRAEQACGLPDHVGEAIITIAAELTLATSRAAVRILQGLGGSICSRREDAAFRPVT
jgi:hypothetical protein